ncbi:FimB/Mfa2 family fimbrial subunit [Pedobacter alluvionis]|nr:FimB/Mfa2 family fimbrial subunit [Pedobacter alluvionis]TFB30976.1 hypothetical protein E3V97_10140 [Pedobacter alluvionis]
MRRIFIIILVLMVSAQACIKENLEDCEFKIAVYFTQPDSCNNRPVYTKSGQLTVFAFNQSGILSGRFSNAGVSFGLDEQITLNLKQGVYTLVAVAGLSDEHFANQSLINGQTRLSEFYIPSYVMKDGNKETENGAFFIGILQQVKITQNNAYSIAMKLVGKPLNLTLNGGLVNHSYQARISYNAIGYSLTNNLTYNFATDHFTMAKLYTNAIKQDVYHANTGVLWPVGNQASRLIIRDLINDVDIFNADIKALLAKFSQVDFNCEPVIDIQINYSLSHNIEIVINGWKVQYSEMEL